MSKALACYNVGMPEINIDKDPTTTAIVEVGESHVLLGILAMVNEGRLVMLSQNGRLFGAFVPFDLEQATSDYLGMQNTPGTTDHNPTV